jgi:hypothetical protein
MPVGARVIIDDEHHVVCERQKQRRWHIRFGGEEVEKRNTLRLKTGIIFGDPVAGVRRWPQYGPELAASKEYLSSGPLGERWFDKLDDAIQDAKEQVVTTDSVRRLRGR